MITICSTRTIRASSSGCWLHRLFFVVAFFRSVLKDFVVGFSFISIDNRRRMLTMPEKVHIHNQEKRRDLRDRITFHVNRRTSFPTFVTSNLLQQSALLSSWNDIDYNDNGVTNPTMIDFDDEVNPPLDAMLTQEMNMKNTSNVSGLQCVHVQIHLPIVGCITILEADAESQEILVDLALEDESSSQQQQEPNNNNQQQQIDPSINDDCISLSKGDPYGAVLWPASSAVASYLLTKQMKCNSSITNDDDYTFFLNNKIVIEIGAGTGLISIAAAISSFKLDNQQLQQQQYDVESSQQSTTNPIMNTNFLGAKAVIAADYEYVPLKLLRYAAKNLNPQCNDQILHTTYFDICNFNMTLSSLLLKLNSSEKSSFDNSNHIVYPNDVVIVASDIMYEPKTGIAMAKRVIEALDCGYHVIIGDSPGRAGRPAFLNELERHFSSIISSSNATIIIPHFMNVAGNKVNGDRHELICSKDSTTRSKEADSVAFETIYIAIMDLDPFIYRT